MTELNIPELSLVALVGASGSGKTTFGREHFGPYEVISSDFCRGLVADDENDNGATRDAFDVLHYIAGKRLDAGRLTVVDATNVQREARRSLVQLAREHDVLPVAIVLDLPEKVCVERTQARPDRDFGARVVRRQRDQLRRSLRGLAKEGFRKVHVLSSVEEVAAATVVREKLLSDYRDQHGPFDVIGDVHGCRSELEALLTTLGYELVRDEQGRPVDAVPPGKRRAVFVGDLVDRGPDSPGVLRLVMGMVGAGHALCVPGNHEHKLVRALGGSDVRIAHGLAETLDQLSRESEEFRRQVADFCYGLVSHLVLDDGRLVVAHAGLKEAYHGRASGRVRSFALYGDTTGETDEFGLPVRYPWANDYRGRAMVLYGHTPTPETEWVNNTMCLDTGCVFGGKLTALRYPEKDVVSVPAERVWYEPAKPFPVAAGPAAPGEREPGQLDVDDVLGKRIVETAPPRPGHRARGERRRRARGDEPVRTPPALGAVPAADDGAGRDLGPPGPAGAPGRGVRDVRRRRRRARSSARRSTWGRGPSCWSAATTTAAAARFGATARRNRCGLHPHRPVVLPPRAHEALLERVRRRCHATGLWEELDTDWLLLDAELLPWSAKAEELLREQYAATGAAARAALPAAVSGLEAARARGIDVAGPARPDPARARERRGVHRGLPALLLADRGARRRRASRRSRCSRRGCDVPRPRPRLAPRDRRPAGRGRARTLFRIHPADGGRDRRPRVRRRRRRLVGGR